MFSTADGFTKNLHAYDGHGDSVDSTSSQPADRPKTVELNRGLRKPAEQVPEPKKKERELQHEFAAELEQLKEVSAGSRQRLGLNRTYDVGKSSVYQVHGTAKKGD